MQEILLGHAPSGGGVLGDLVDGVRFFGEVPGPELITMANLASTVGLSVGTIGHNSSPWLHFELDGKTLYVAKQIVRYGLSFNQLSALGIVFGETTVTIQDRVYKVRLLTGTSGNMTTVISGNPVYNHPITAGSEWNRLIYKIWAGDTHLPIGYWPYYTSADFMFFDGTYARGIDIWTQNQLRSKWMDGSRILQATRRIISPAGLGNQVPNSTSLNYGWLPVLELVE